VWLRDTIGKGCTKSRLLGCRGRLSCDIADRYRNISYGGDGVSVCWASWPFLIVMGKQNEKIPKGLRANGNKSVCYWEYLVANNDI